MLAYTGNPGSTPILQVGGVHEAVITVPPRLCVVREFVPVEFVVELNDATSGVEVLQVNGGFVIGKPRVSMTVAFSVTELPLLTMMEFVVLFAACSRMYWTRHVVIGSELLAVPATLAYRRVMPGLPAVIWTKLNTG